MHTLIAKIFIVAAFTFTGVAEEKQEAKPPPDKPDNATVDTLMTNLGAEDFETRDQAYSKLLALCEDYEEIILASCVRNYAVNEDPEIRQRLYTIMRQLIVPRYYPIREPGFLGVSLDVSTPMEHDQKKYIPVVIRSIEPGTSAVKAGLKYGDQILSIDTHDCTDDFSCDSFANYIISKREGDTITLKLLSRKGVKTKKIVLGSRPFREGEHDKAKEKQQERFDSWLADKIAAIKKTSQCGVTP